MKLKQAQQIVNMLHAVSDFVADKADADETGVCQEILAEIRRTALKPYENE